MVFQLIIALILVTLSFNIVYAQDLLKTSILSGLFSVFITLFYILSEAPDVAITEAVVNASLSTIFTIFSIAIVDKHILHANHQFDLVNFNTYVFMVIASIGFAVSLSFIFSTVSKIETSSIYTVGELTTYAAYKKNIIADFDIPNLVTAILAGYRGIDTLFETVVICLAATGVNYILRPDEQQDVENAKIKTRE
jgi:multicomponent Na+:H+ antiporter subunit B